jgi:hypothetical protein
MLKAVIEQERRHTELSPSPLGRRYTVCVGYDDSFAKEFLGQFHGFVAGPGSICKDRVAIKDENPATLVGSSVAARQNAHFFATVR